MVNKIVIRKPKLEELKRVIRITKQAYKVPYKERGIITKSPESPDFISKYQNKEFEILVLILNGKIAGAVRYFYPEKSKLYFYRLAVLKSFRNRGIASKLIGKIEKIAKRKKIKMVVLDCMKEKQLPNYYKRLGYKISKIIFKKSQRYHEVYMYKKV